LDLGRKPPNLLKNSVWGFCVFFARQIRETLALK
jgi:hypothetical protein